MRSEARKRDCPTALSRRRLDAAQTPSINISMIVKQLSGKSGAGGLQHHFTFLVRKTIKI